MSLPGFFLLHGTANRLFLWSFKSFPNISSMFALLCNQYFLNLKWQHLVVFWQNIVTKYAVWIRYAHSIRVAVCIWAKKAQDYVEDEPFNDVSEFSSVADTPWKGQIFWNIIYTNAELVNKNQLWALPWISETEIVLPHFSMATKL